MFESSWTVIPSYGRDYKSKAEVMAAWNDGKDFQIPGGPHINKQDFDASNMTDIHIRYAKQTKIIILKRK